MSTLLRQSQIIAFSPYATGWRFGPPSEATFAHVAYRDAAKETWFAAQLEGDADQSPWFPQIWVWRFSGVRRAQRVPLSRADETVVAITVQEYGRLMRRENDLFFPAFHARMDELTLRRRAVWLAHGVPWTSPVPSTDMLRAARDHAHRMVRTADGLVGNIVRVAPDGTRVVVRTEEDIEAADKEYGVGWECDEAFKKELDQK